MAYSPTDGGCYTSFDERPFTAGAANFTATGRRATLRAIRFAQPICNPLPMNWRKIATSARSGFAIWSGNAKSMPGWKSRSMPPKNGVNRWGTSSSTGRRGLARRRSPPASRAISASRSRSPAGRRHGAQGLIPYLTNAEQGSVLFIDEIHRLPKPVEEFLYPAMEDFRIDILLGEGVNARTINMPLRPFTLIGATTRAGLISAPLRDRFHLREHLDFYTVAELAEIVRRSAIKLQVEITRRAPRRSPAAVAARPISEQPPPLGPRFRHQQSRRPDYARTREGGPGDAGDRCAGPRRTGSKVSGNDRPRFSRRAGRVEAVAHTLDTSPDTLSDEVEPFLLRSELVIRTRAAGRSPQRVTRISDSPYRTIRRPIAVREDFSDELWYLRGHVRGVNQH